MRYLISFFILLICIYSIKYAYDRAKLTRMLQYRGIVEGEWISRIIKELKPKEDSKKYVKLSNRIYLLDHNANIDILYFWKIVSFCSLTVLIAVIMATNIYMRRADAFDIAVDADGKASPVIVNKGQYNHLSKGLSFAKGHTSADLKRLSENMESSGLNDVLKNVSDADIYSRLTAIHKGLENSFSCDTVFLFFLASWLTYFVPNLILFLVVQRLDSIAYFEFIRLETLIYLKTRTYYKMDDILDRLIYNSLAYRELFKMFVKIYEVDSDLAYTMVASESVFPPRFATLIQYLNMLENDGAKVVGSYILANKKACEEEIANYLKERASRRKRILIYIIFFCFCATIMICLPMLIKNLSFSDFSAM